MESSPERVFFPPAMIALWNQWQLRCLVVISFTMQATLTILGNRRNFNTKIFLRVIIWLSYLIADAVAGLALGIFSQNNPEETSHVLVLWIPLLLLHLGGPDFITAYSLEDNELWLRHFLGLVVQVGGAFYVFLKSWNTSSPVTYMAIPLFVAGLIKYGERTWALKSATSEEFIEKARDKADAGESSMPELDFEGDSTPTKKKMNLIATAYSYLQVAGSVLTAEKGNSLSQKCAISVKKNSFKNVYDIIEIELGILYNWFYTKSQIFYSPAGFLLRLIGSCCLITVTVAFVIFQRQRYDKIDVAVSYLLLVGAILLEIYSVFQLLVSDWMIILLYNFKRSGRTETPSNPEAPGGRDLVQVKGLKIAEAICRIKVLVDGKHWSRKMGRLNLLDYVLEKHLTWYYIPKMWDKHFYKTSEELPSYLQALIFKELADDCRRSVSKWSQEIEGKYGNEQLKWIFELSFSDSVLVWHIATEMLYIHAWNTDHRANRLLSEISYDNRELSRRISEYMMYLLVVCPTMIPGGVQNFKISAACDCSENYLDPAATRENKRRSYTEMLSRMIHNEKTRGRESTTNREEEMKNARRLAVMFLSCSGGRNWTEQRRWKMIREVWLEMLFYAANQCKWEAHVQHLRRGGEFLTHVWMLMLLLRGN